MLIICIAISVTCVISVYNVVSPVLEPYQISMVFASMCIFWISMEFGIFAFHSLWHDYTSKKIQRELDTERAFRKMGGN